MERPQVALKVDVDTWTGTRDGVPRLLAILERFGIRATFYFSMGPDNSGKAVRRIFTRKGFLKKMLRTRAPSMYGLRTILSGTLLPAPMIAETLPHILKSCEEKGHEAGIHCWDHVEWHDNLPKMTMETVAAELNRAGNAFRRVFGHSAGTTAAPGWTVSPLSLAVQDGLQLLCCSDARGETPFYPVVGGTRYNTLQVPTTWPTMDEILGEKGITGENINDHYISLLKPGLNVHTIHAELEGTAMGPVFIELLERLRERDVRFLTMGEIADEHAADAPSHLIYMGELPGRAGLVAIQGKRV
jgi:undecaprenyl phosphate-alpha-L-ara4FN deformylase